MNVTIPADDCIRYISMLARPYGGGMLRVFLCYAHIRPITNILLKEKFDLAADFLLSQTIKNYNTTIYLYILSTDNCVKLDSSI